MTTDKIKVTVDSDLEELIPGFLANREKDLSRLKEALDNRTYETAQSVGHSLKGVGGGYGFDRMSEIGAAIEQAAKSSDHDAIKSLLTDLEDYLNRIEVNFE